jgi:hypothetical protein
MEWTNAAGCWIDGRRVSFRAYAHQERGLVRVNEWGVLKLKFLQPTVFSY